MAELLRRFPVAFYRGRCPRNESAPAMGAFRANRVELLTAGIRVTMRQDADGWWSVEIEDRLSRTDYAFSIDGGDPFPDPRSCFQPEGVTGFSRPIDHSEFQWSDGGWRSPGSALR